MTHGAIDRIRILPALGMLVAMGFAGCADVEQGEMPDDDAALIEEGAERPGLATEPVEEPATERADEPGAERAPDPVPDTRAVVPAGTTLTFRVDETISTDSHQEGDTFTATLGNDLTAPDGTLVMAEGSRSRWVVTRSTDDAPESEEALLAFGLESIEVDGEWRPVEATVTNTDVRIDEGDTGTETAAKVAVGAAAGAIIGQVLGRDTRATLTGAGVGAAVGTIVALTTRDGDAELPEGSTLTVRLDESVSR